MAVFRPELLPTDTSSTTLLPIDMAYVEQVMLRLLCVPGSPLRAR